MKSFDSYYDAPDDIGDFISTMIDEINEFIIEKNPVESPDCYDPEFREASCVIESLVIAAMRDEKLLEALRSNIELAKRTR
jgi:hypothetical protein